jgi:malonyl-CoA decarboxylase
LQFKIERPDLDAVDADFAHLFNSWFNRGFLVLRPIDWSTPADILEKIIRYEAVHEIGSWDELRRRLAPPDRRCFAFFHPQLAGEPLIFVEVALTREMPTTIAEVLDESGEHLAPDEARTAVFYSISNCQKGLRGISFGNFLIKQVVEELRRDLPRLDTFVTLSPVPGFAGWLSRERENGNDGAFGEQERKALAALEAPGWAESERNAEAVRQPLLEAAGWYFLNARDGAGKPVDPVARFHLGNGARLERINFLGDRSPRAMRQAHGLMVNYRYKLDDIEANHEAFASRGEVVAAPAVRRLVRAARPQRGAGQTASEKSPPREGDEDRTIEEFSR